jgi:hypothetical protein
VRLVPGATLSGVAAGVAMIIGFAGIAVGANVGGLRRLGIIGRKT